MKIYTRVGDDGETALFGGMRVSKDALRVEAYGTVDELNSCLGLAVTTLTPGMSELAELLLLLQAELFDIGAELATPPERAATKLADRLSTVTAQQVTVLEDQIDRFEAQLEPLQSFILPGGSAASAALHVARTVARRAERRIVSLAAAEPVNPTLISYMNRVSDLLFVLARSANRLLQVADIPWTTRK